MRLRWTRLALSDFERAHYHIAQENPAAARHIAEHIRDAARRLIDYPHIGRVGEDEDTREWPVPRTPYLIVYRLRGDAIELLRVWHTKQDWRTSSA